MFLTTVLLPNRFKRGNGQLQLGLESQENETLYMIFKVDENDGKLIFSTTDGRFTIQQHTEHKKTLIGSSKSCQGQKRCLFTIETLPVDAENEERINHLLSSEHGLVHVVIRTKNKDKYRYMTVKKTERRHKSEQLSIHMVKRNDSAVDIKIDKYLL